MGLEVFKLDGRVALITGGNRGLGLVMARSLAEAGADVVVTSRQKERAEESAAAIAQATGRRALGLAVDVTNAAQVENMVQTVLQALAISILWSTTLGSIFASRLKSLMRRVGIWCRAPI